MSRFCFLFILSLSVFISQCLKGNSPVNSVNYGINLNRPDTLVENQALYNGRMWKNQYYRARQHQFLFSKEFLSGSLSINGNRFDNLKIRYDIFDDEIMTPANFGAIIQLNKEMVDSFSILYDNKTYRFIKSNDNSGKGFSGYVNVIYKGVSALYVKYRKEITSQDIQSNYMFVQSSEIYFVNNGISRLVRSKRDLLSLLSEDKVQIKSFIKKNKLKVSIKNPESFAPVLDYYDSLVHK
jgi:hypothetical protein